MQRAAKMYWLHISRYILGLHSNNGKLFCLARKLQNKLRHTNRTLCIKVALDAFTKQRKSMGKKWGLHEDIWNSVISQNIKEFQLPI